MKEKERETFERAVHRPLPYLLAGFTEADRAYAMERMKEAARYMLAQRKGSDGLTDGDRDLVGAAYACDDWREIARMARLAETEKARDIIRGELQLAMEMATRRRRRMYDDR